MKIKKNKIVYGVILSMLIFAYSCSDNNAKYIPGDAFAVAVIDGKELLKEYKPEMLENNEEFLKIQEEYNIEFDKSMELFDKIINDPEKSGILLKNKIFAFANFVENKMTIGLIVPVDKELFEKNLILIGEDIGFPVLMLFRTKNKIKHFKPNTHSIIAYNDDVMILLHTSPAVNSFELAEHCLNLPKNESVIKNKDFADFLKNCKDINLWVSSDVFNYFDDKKEEISQLTEYTGIDISNNYGHFYLDLSKKEIVCTQKIRFNKSVQKTDIKTLLDNSEKIIALFKNININIKDPEAAKYETVKPRKPRIIISSDSDKESIDEDIEELLNSIEKDIETQKKDSVPSNNNDSI